jgi:formate hydrogenlyase subunit 4
MALGASAGLPALLEGGVVYLAKLAALAASLVVFEVSIAKMRVFRVGEFLGGALMLGFLGTLLLFVSRSM